MKQRSTFQSGNQQGFVLLAVILAVAALSMVVVTTMNEAGVSLRSGYFTERLMKKTDAAKTAGMMCAQYGVRFNQNVLLNFDQQFVDTAEMKSNTASIGGQLVVSLDGRKADSEGVYDDVSDPHNVIVQTGQGGNGYTWFIDPDTEGMFKAVPRSEGPNYGLSLGNVSDCSGEAFASGLLCGGGSLSTDESGNVGTAGDTRTNYMLVTCNVVLQQNQYLQTDGTFDAGQPHERVVVTYKFDTVNGTVATF